MVASGPSPSLCHYVGKDVAGSTQGEAHREKMKSRDSKASRECVKRKRDEEGGG